MSKALSQAKACELFDYRDGVLYWRVRPVTDFHSEREWKIINKRNAGKAAGTKNDSGYLTVRTTTFRLRAHHIVWLMFNGYLPAGEIDHINGDPGDNRIENLREVTPLENRQNMARPVNNTSGHIGVSYRGKRRRWRAYIMVDNRQVNLGHYREIEQAISARKAAERELGFHPNHGR